MLRVFVLICAGVFGMYFFEQYTGIVFGVSHVIHGLGDIVGETTGFSLFGGGFAGGYGTATSVGQSVGDGVSGLGSGIGNSMRSIGGN